MNRLDLLYKRLNVYFSYICATYITVSILPEYLIILATNIFIVDQDSSIYLAISVIMNTDQKRHPKNTRGGW